MHQMSLQARCHNSAIHESQWLTSDVRDYARIIVRRPTSGLKHRPLHRDRLSYVVGATVCRATRRRRGNRLQLRSVEPRRHDRQRTSCQYVPASTRKAPISSQNHDGRGRNMKEINRPCVLGEWHVKLLLRKIGAKEKQWKARE